MKKKIIIPVKELALIALVVLCVILLFKGCQQNSAYKNAQGEIENLLKDKKGLEIIKDEQGREIADVRATVITRNRQIEKQLKEIKELKTLDVKIKLVNKTKYDTITVMLHDTSVVYKEQIVIAKQVKFDDKWLKLSGYVYANELKLDSIVVQNKYTIELGDKKVGLFKKEKTIYVKNENPHTTTTDMQSFVLKDERKWFEKSGVKILATALLTTIILRNF